MDAQTIARLMTAGLAQPTGSDDTGLYTGVVLTWDASSGVNTVQVNGVAMSNLRVVQSGIGLAYQPGDTVMVQRKGSQYYIQGKVGAPGAGAGNQIASADVNVAEATTSTSYTDLGTYGPEVSVYVGSSRRVLLLVSATILCTGAVSGTAIGGAMAIQVSGASALSPIGSCEAAVAGQGTGMYVGTQATYTRQRLLTAANGLNAGMTTFTAKYLSNRTDVGPTFNFRTLTVIPF